MRAALLTTILLGLAPVASAATVDIRAFPLQDRSNVPDPPGLHFAAEPGERNRVTLAVLDHQSLQVTDAGAPLGTGPGCRSVDEHTAICVRPGRLAVLVLSGARDRDDRRPGRRSRRPPGPGHGR
jgi:hypothetical protein